MIHARGLTKVFKTRRGRTVVENAAVNGIDLDVEKGEVLGFLGPNGAGKSTTMKMLTTLARPTSGTATVAGYDVAGSARDVRRRIGYVPQTGTSSRTAVAGDEIVYHAMLYGLTKKEAADTGRMLLEKFKLAEAWNRPVASLSGGQRRRLDITMSLIHSPDILFLDEPTVGLDPQARSDLWQHIRLLRDDGVTVFLSTHYLDEADALSDRIVIVDRGKVIASDTPAGIKSRGAGERITFVMKSAAEATSAANTVQEESGIIPYTSGNTVSWLMKNATSAAPSLMRKFDERGFSVEGMDIRSPSLEDMFLLLTGRSIQPDS